MKKLNTALLSLFFALQIFLPLCGLIVLLTDLRFSLNGHGLAYLSTALSVAITVTAILLRKHSAHTAGAVLAGLSLPFSGISTAIYCLLCGGMFVGDGMIPTALGAVSVLCALILLLLFARPRALGITVAVCCAVALVPLWMLTMFLSVFGGIAENTTVATEISPQQTYRAEIVDSDQGALGGDTFVEVYDQRRETDLWLIRFYQAPKRVWSGDWGLASAVELSWTDDETLRINGTEYDIDTLFS